MNGKISLFFRDSYHGITGKGELAELVGTAAVVTVIVLAATLVITLVVWLMDVIASSAQHAIYSFIYLFRLINVYMYCCQKSFL